MQLENSFSVAAPPERVFEYLLDVNKVAGCVPGAELSEVVDPTTFKGKVKVKVGPITVAYSGTARITERNEAERTATLSAEGRETTGPGSARATAVMRVDAADGGSMVKIDTDYHIAGRVAQFGRGVMEDVSRRMVNEMAACIKSNLESSSGPSDGAPERSAGEAGQAPAPRPQATAQREVNALAILWHLVALRVRRLFGSRSA